MADTTKNMNNSREQDSSKTGNQTMQNEQAKGSASGERQEKGVIGGGGQQSGQSNQNTTGQNKPGQDKDFDKNRSEFDKNRSEPTSR